MGGKRAPNQVAAAIGRVNIGNGGKKFWSGTGKVATQSGQDLQLYGAAMGFAGIPLTTAG